MLETLICVAGLTIGILIIILIFFVYKIKRIQEICRNQIDEKEKEFQLRESEIRKDSIKRSRSGLKGKLGEQFIPLMGAKFGYMPSDARFIGDPIDYIIFDNYTNIKEGVNDDPVTIVIAEIKTGKSRLKKHQNRIRNAVKEGRIKWDLISLELSEEESKEI